MKAASMIRAAGSLLLTAGLLAGCAVTQPTLPDRFAVGRDSNANRCTASRSWNDPQLTSQFDSAYAIACEGVSASRAMASISVVPAKTRKAEKVDDCGAPSTIDVAGIGPVEARRCNDQALAARAVVISFKRGGTSYRGAAVSAVIDPMARALAALATGKLTSADAAMAPSGITVAALADAPAVATAAGDATFDPNIPLRDGISLNRQGLYAEASRVLNDALSRLSGDTASGVKVELLLEAALADSNIQFGEAARDHFAQAETLLATIPESDQTAFLQRKRSTYLALDALNRRNWPRALAALNTAQASFPLENPALIAELNRPKSNDVSSAVSSRSSAQLSQVVLDAKRGWATSVALLAQNAPGALDKGKDALQDSAIRVGGLLGDPQVSPAALLWLTAQIERQSGRIDARTAESATGDVRRQGYAKAVGKFDCALAVLRAGHPTAESACAIPLDTTTRARLIAAAGQGMGPVIPETQIERASLREQAGDPASAVLADYSQAIETLLASGRGGASAPSRLEDYLDLLIKTSKGEGAEAKAATDSFFQAIQAVGEPGISRQLSQLQQVVSADSGTAMLLRQRAELNRDIAGLRYQIADATADPAARAALDETRKAKEGELIALEDKLQSNRRAQAIDDRPVTIAEVQAKLAPDELYFKLSEIRARTYGIVIAKTGATVYAAGESSANLRKLAKIVRTSVRLPDGSRAPFKVAESYALFSLISGPAERQLASAKAIVVDPAGPLANLPASVLVTDKASVTAYINGPRTQAKGITDPVRRRAVLNDYSQVNFLANEASLSIALSPRSFVDTRGLPESTASNPFIGFGNHGLPMDVTDANMTEQIGLGCPVSRAELARISEANEPIDARKLDIAANALGVPDAPRVTGEAFTDTAVINRDDLSSYQVVHFATHGLPEIKLGCATVPPSLLTTLGPPHSDGFLSFNEVAGLRLNANLVVLSACDTAASASRASARRSGQEDSGRSLDGLVRAFLTANARAVLATYWPVSVAGESDELFKTFYTRGRTEEIADALHDAQRGLMRQPAYSHPYFWRAYFVVGDASKTMLDKPRTVASK